MYTLPPRKQQIIDTHAKLIVEVVKTVQNPSLRPKLQPALEASAANGWTDLVAAINKILNGTRDESIIKNLDEEDGVIIQAILRGIQNPETLPDPTIKPDPAMAAPGLANMIHACTKGDVTALEIISEMAEQMVAAGGDLARVGGQIRRLIEGVRDPDILTKGMGKQGESLMLSLLNELNLLEAH